MTVLVSLIGVLAGLGAALFALASGWSLGGAMLAYAVCGSAAGLTLVLTALMRAAQDISDPLPHDPD